MSSSRLLLLFTTFVLLFRQNFSSPSKQRLLLPLKKTHGRHLRDVSIAASAPHKVGFQHNVTLTVSLSVGVPPQNVSMVVDTGSELSWLHCKKAPNLTSIFTPQTSKSYKPVPSSSPLCKSSTPGLIVPASGDPNDKFCHVAVSYADGTSIEGALAHESLIIGSVSPSELLFGCMGSGFSSTSEEDLKTTGMMGMNLGSLSFAKQMSLSKFSYCISGSDSSGVLIFGDATFSGLKGLNYTPLILKSDPLPAFDRFAYSVQLEGIKVGNKMLNLPKSAFSLELNGAGQTMIDSGTQFSYLKDPAYTELRKEFLQQTKGILRVYEDSSFVFQNTMDLCYRVANSSGANFSNLPRVTLMFQGAEMSVSSEWLLYQVPGMNKGNDSIYCFTFGSSDKLGIEAFMIGNHHQQNMWVEYDLAKSRIGFAEMKCDLAGQKLGTGL